MWSAPRSRTGTETVARRARAVRQRVRAARAPRRTSTSSSSVTTAPGVSRRSRSAARQPWTRTSPTIRETTRAPAAPPGSASSAARSATAGPWRPAVGIYRGVRAPESEEALRQDAVAAGGSAEGEGQPGCRSGREQLVEAARAIELPQLDVAADRIAVDQDLRNRPAAGRVEHLLAEVGVVVERELLERKAALLEQRLSADAVAAPARRIDLNPGHPS